MICQPVFPDVSEGLHTHTSDVWHSTLGWVASPVVCQRVELMRAFDEPEDLGHLTPTLARVVSVSVKYQAKEFVGIMIVVDRTSL